MRSDPATDAGARTRDEGGRWVALDLLRFVAVALMVQGHVFTALLDARYEGERWLRHHNFVHGYTAPMFLFASGLAFGFTTFRRWSSNTRWGSSLARRFGRYGWLLVIGYALHLPARGLRRLTSLDEAALRTWMQVDVLQHIGTSLALLQLLAIVTRRERSFVAVVALLMVVSVFSAPVVWSTDVAWLPLPLQGYVNASNGSMFPLVPWAGFTHAGVLVAYGARSFPRPSRAMAWPLSMLTIAFFVLPIVLNRAGVAVYGPHDFWKTDPYYFFFRLANVLAVLTVGCFVERFFDVRGALGARPSSTRVGAVLEMVRVVGAESLVVYVVHLLLLHGSVLTRGLEHVLGRTLSVGSALLVAALLLAAMIALARVWHEWKKDERRFRIVRWSAAGAVACLVLVGP